MQSLYVCLYGKTSFSCVLRIFSLLMNAVKLDTKSPDISRTSLLGVLLQVSQLFETFVISSYPHYHPKEGKKWLLRAREREREGEEGEKRGERGRGGERRGRGGGERGKERERRGERGRGGRVSEFFPLSHTDEDVALLKLAHTFIPDLDMRHCSSEVRPPSVRYGYQ